MFTGSPSQMIPMNLQLFAEGEPIDPPATDPTPPSNPTPPQDPGPSDPTPNLEQPKFKIKFNHEEKELGYDEAVPLIQKGMNYDKMQERLNSLQSNPALSWVEQQAKTHGLTTEQYIEAVSKQQEQDRLNQLIQQNVPEEYAREMLENRKFREQYESERQTKAQQEKQQAEFQAFIEAYPDVKPETIPVEVWVEAEKGRSLVDAYRSHENQLLRTQITELNQKIQTQEVNKQNAASSTGSLTGQGSVPSDFITKDTYESNKSNQSWMQKNYENLVKSMRKWQ